MVGAPAAADTALFDATVARPAPAEGPGGFPEHGATVSRPEPDSTPAPWAAAPPPWLAPSVDSAGRGSGSRAASIGAHIVFWVGTVLFTVLDAEASGFILSHVPGPYQLGSAAIGLLEALPFAVAVLVGARSTAARWIALTGAVVATGVQAYAYTRLFSSSGENWELFLLDAVVVLAAATWQIARGHARLAALMLIPVAAIQVLWSGSWGPIAEVTQLPYRHGEPGALVSAFWQLIPILVAAGIIALGALIRPRPAPERDHVGWAEIGPLALVVLLMIPVLPLLSSSGSTATASSSVPDYSGAAASATSSAGAVAAARSFLDAAVSGADSVAGCNGAVAAPSVASYTIGQVSPTTSGRFDVSATVTAADGSVQVVTIEVGTASSGGTGAACVAVATAPNYSGSSEQAAGGFPVPSVPSSGDPVPSGTTVPVATVSGAVIPYSGPSRTPTTETQLVAHEPAGLSSDQTAAVQSLIRFMTAVNQQDFQTAWSASTYSIEAATYSAGFANGYATSRHFEVSFGQPQQLTPTLVAVPATFVSRQDPAAQGNPPGVTGCTYWPQYVFLAASVGGSWLDDTAGVFGNDPTVAPLKRADPSRNGALVLNPLSQRVAC